MDVSWNWGTSSGFPMLINTNPHSSPFFLCELPISDPSSPGSGPAPLAVKKTHPRRYPEHCGSMKSLAPSTASRHCIQATPGVYLAVIGEENAKMKQETRSNLLLLPMIAVLNLQPVICFFTVNFCKSLEDHNLMEPVPLSCSPQSLVVHSHCASGSILSGHPVASKSSRDATWVCLKMGYTSYTPSFILIGKLIKHVGAPHFQSNPLIGSYWWSNSWSSVIQCRKGSKETKLKQCTRHIGW